MSKTQNILTAFLGLLGVRHTVSFSEQTFNEHPHRYNLFGLSKMLSDYGIRSGGIEIPDKANDITAIQTPFIAQFSGNFVAVYEVNPDNVSFIWKGLHHNLTVEKFIESWTGVVLLVEKSEQSGEPNYETHRRAEILENLKQTTLFSGCGMAVLFAYLYNMYYTEAGISLLLVVNLVGLLISGLLLLKQMHIQSDYADKICSLFKQKDCNNVLESKAAKLFGVISWSEIGFGYFLSNMLLLLFFPASVTAIALLNVLTLPFTLWSVWYQGVKAKQWCMLCLIIVALLWTIFFLNLLFGFIYSPFEGVWGNSPFEGGRGMSGMLKSIESYAVFFQLAFTLSIYFVSVLGLNLLAPKLNADRKIQSLKQTINGLKADDDVFKALLKKQPYYETSDRDSIIHFGNPASKLRLTVFSNPYCNPCAAMHKQIEDLRKQVNDNISIRYILSSFGENFNRTNKYLIAACLMELTTNHLPLSTIFNAWFEKGKAMKDDYFKDMGLDVDNPEVEAEFQKHEAWKQKTQIKATPTVLVNGYKLPESYKMEDLRYFTDLDM